MAGDEADLKAFSESTGATGILAAQALLHDALETRRSGTEHRSEFTSFEELGGWPITKDLFDALESSHILMDGIYRRASKDDARDEKQLNRRINANIYRKIVYGVIAASIKSGGNIVLLSPGITASFCTKLLPQEDSAIFRSDGLIVRGDSIAAGIKCEMDPSSDEVKKQLTDFKLHVERGRTLFEENPGLLIVIPKIVRARLPEIPGVVYMTLPITRKDLNRFRNSKIMPYRPNPDAPTILEAWRARRR